MIALADESIVLSPMMRETLRETVPQFRPRSSVRSLEWVREYVRRDDGRPFDLGTYPHFAAPGNPFEAFDNPDVREIWLRWGTRLGKTFFGLSLQLFIAACMPAPAIIGSSTELLTEGLCARLWKMFALCEPLRRSLPPKHRQPASSIHWPDSITYGAWAGSISTLADREAWFAHVNEADKHKNLKTSDDAGRPGKEGAEGDSVKLLIERTKNNPTRKALIEGTTTRKGRSRLERGIRNSTDRRLHVQCPRCGEYQVLMFGGRDVKGGIRWEKGPDGHSDPNIAYYTAWYQCRHCEGRIDDADRPAMMRSGVWLGAGQSIDHNGEIRGELRRTPVEGYTLSSLYALVLTWGDIAKAFIEAKRPQELQNFANAWLAEEWERHGRQQTWEMVGARLKNGAKSGVAPIGTVFLTCGVDKQAEHYVYKIEAYGEGARGSLVAHGYAYSEAELETAIYEQRPREDGGPPLRPRLTLIDSGFEADVVYKLCKRLHSPKLGVFVLPCKGVDVGDQAGEPYTVRKMGQERKSVRHAGLSKQVLVRVTRNYWEEVTAKQLEELSPADEGSLSLNEEAANDKELIEQLLNATDVDGRWDKANPEIPDDYRAAHRYARCAAEVLVKGDWRTVSYSPPQRTRSADAARTKTPRPATKAGKSLKYPKGWLKAKGI